MLRIAELWLEAAAITDRSYLAGVVRAWSALRELARGRDKTLRIRSTTQIDACSRQEIGRPQDLPRGALPQLPRLIVARGCASATAR